jgi:hypothetical protein
VDDGVQVRFMNYSFAAPVIDEMVDAMC